MKEKRVKVSKFLSFVLRHKPERFDLLLDRYGFAELLSVIKILKTRFPKIEITDLRDLVTTDPNQRFQIKGMKIRARYGHSVETEPLEETQSIPNILYHGTSSKNLESILKEGLKPGRRKFIHLSVSVSEATRVGKRKDLNPVVLKIDAERARKEGLVFWREGNVFLTKKLPPIYISLFFQ